ncbi:hypothetical protein TrLO_g7306 [Triparma laevis f. longispina]|uniref:BspA family leucine-rich repeat surface protein n=1 Tax=Triparma laevis f. longispina TaxID=1714387 RepID=A0A9W7DPE4_9STRA|nr:hypothetical protein TrLO_g7306 [Triparma laevis f. longispina]
MKVDEKEAAKFESKNKKFNNESLGAAVKEWCKDKVAAAKAAAAWKAIAEDNTTLPKSKMKDLLGELGENFHGDELEIQIEKCGGFDLQRDKFVTWYREFVKEVLQERSGECIALQNLGPIRDWDTSEVTSMEKLFGVNDDGAGKAAETFNDDISRWNVGRVENMDQMFLGCSTFDQDLSGWNVENVQTMNWMFASA